MWACGPSQGPPINYDALSDRLGRRRLTRTTKMSRTPSMSRKSSFAAPSRLNVPPSLRPSPSLSNLHIHSNHSSTSGLPVDSAMPRTARDAFLDSSASSIANLDVVSTEGILVHETDSTIDALDALEGVAAQAQIEQPPIDTSESAQILREHLKKSLSTNFPQQGVYSQLLPGKYLMLIVRQDHPPHRCTTSLR